MEGVKEEGVDGATLLDKCDHVSNINAQFPLNFYCGP